VAGSQTLVAYAAEAGTSAEDGVGDDAHSPFTAALLKHLPEPGEDIRFAFGRIRDDVLKATDKRQRPFVYGSLGGDHISLVPGLLALNDVKGDYDRADKVGTRRAFEVFLAQYPTGYYADLAREALGKLPAPAPPAPDDERAWEKIKDTTDQAALRSFIKRFPDSPLATNAEHRLQVLADGEVTRAWERVDKNDAAAIHKFIKAFSASTLAAGTGKARLNELDQQARDREAQKQAEIAAAKEREAEREAVQVWQMIKNTNNRNAVLGFINLHADSPLLAEAQQRLVAIDQEERERKAKQEAEAEAAEAKQRQLERDAQEWEKVKLSTDPSALLAFLSRNPNATVSDQARQRLADLDREAKKREQEAAAAEAKKQTREHEATQEWEKIGSSTDQTELLAFLHRYRQAKEAWETVKDSADPGIIRGFIKQYPASLVALIDANERLLAVEREAYKNQTEAAARAEWDAVNKSDVAAISNIVTRFPDAPFADDAKKRISELQREERAQVEKAAAARDWYELKNSSDAAAIRAFIRKYPTTSVVLNEAKERLDALAREAEPRPSAVGNSGDANHHLQAASKPEPKPAESAHRPGWSPGARNFSGIGF
jgi:outer membrane protein assembly factor BamD (BamD/ComL family)